MSLTYGGDAPTKRAKRAKTAKPRKTLEQRFWEKVAVAGPDDCWLWTANTLQSNNYGRLGVDGKDKTAHRLSYELANPGILLHPSTPVLHSRGCTSRRCVNPAHLRLGTQHENMRDAAANGTIGKRKLTNDQVLEIIHLAHAGWKQKAIAAHYDIDPRHARDIVSGRRRGALTAELREALAKTPLLAPLLRPTTEAVA